jgi:sortase A
MESPTQTRARKPARSRRRRIIRACATAAMVIGVLAVAEGVVTLVWQEPITAIAAARTQHRLAQQLSHIEAAAPAPAQLQELRKQPDVAARAKVAARRLRASAAPGDPVGRIVFPTLDRHYVLVDGDGTADLRKGPGLYSGTPFPGQGGTTAIAGHRTTYLAPFRHIDQLHVGARIKLEMPYGTFTYAVTGQKIVRPEDVDVVDRPGPGLVLTACHPIYSAKQRIVVFARQVGFTPNRRALGL